MTALSINLPDKLAQASQVAAHKLGISRTSFIRQAIQHELDALQRETEQTEIANTLLALQNDPDYLKETQQWQNTNLTDLPDELEEWWKS